METLLTHSSTASLSVRLAQPALTAENDPLSGRASHFFSTHPSTTDFSNASSCLDLRNVGKPFRSSRATGTTHCAVSCCSTPQHSSVQSVHSLAEFRMAQGGGETALEPSWKSVLASSNWNSDLSDEEAGSPDLTMAFHGLNVNAAMGLDRRLHMRANAIEGRKNPLRVEINEVQPVKNQRSRSNFKAHGQETSFQLHGLSGKGLQDSTGKTSLERNVGSTSKASDSRFKSLPEVPGPDEPRIVRKRQVAVDHWHRPNGTAGASHRGEPKAHGRGTATPSRNRENDSGSKAAVHNGETSSLRALQCSCSGTPEDMTAGRGESGTGRGRTNQEGNKRRKRRHGVPWDSLASQVKALGRAGRVEEAEALLGLNGKGNNDSNKVARKENGEGEGEEEVESEEAPPLVALTIMLGVYERAGLTPSLLSLLSRMRALGMERWDPAVFTAALNCLGRAQLVEEAENLVGDMRLLNVPLHPRHIVSLITMYGRAQNLKKVRGVLELAEERGMLPGTEIAECVLKAARACATQSECSVREQGRAQRRMLLVSRHAPVRQRHALQALWAHKARLLGGGATLDLVRDLEGVVGVLRRHPPWHPSPGWADVMAPLQMLEHTNELPENLEWMIETIAGLPCAAPDPSPPTAPPSSPVPEFFWFSSIQRHRRAGRWARAASLFSAMETAGVQPGQRTLCTVIVVLGEIGDTEKAEEVFRRIEEPDMASYHAIMRLFARQGRADEASSVFREMEGRLCPPQQPDVQSFSILVSACHKAGRGQGALAVYRRMQELGVEMDEVAHNTVLNACGPHIPVEEALQLYRAMEQRGQRVHQKSANHVLGLLARAGRIEDAGELFADLCRKQHTDPWTFCTMADAYGKRRQLDKMEAVVRDAAASGKVTLPLMNCTLDAYGKARLHGNMENVLQRIGSFNLQPDLTSYNTLLHTYGMSGMLPEMEATLRALKAAGLKPDQYTYNILISAYGEMEMPYVSVKVLQEMQEASLLPDAITYRNLIAAFQRAGDYLEAARWSMWAQQSIPSQAF